MCGVFLEVQGRSCGIWLRSPAHSGTIKADRRMLSLCELRPTILSPQVWRCVWSACPLFSWLLCQGSRENTHLMHNPAVPNRLFLIWQSRVVHEVLEGPFSTDVAPLCPSWLSTQERRRAKSSPQGRSLKSQCVPLASLTAASAKGSGWSYLPFSL